MTLCFFLIVSFLACHIQISFAKLVLEEPEPAFLPTTMPTESVDPEISALATIRFTAYQVVRGISANVFHINYDANVAALKETIAMTIAGAQSENIKIIKVNRCWGGSGSCLDVESRDLSSSLLDGSEFIRIARAITEKTTEKLMITYTIEMITSISEADLFNEFVDITSGVQFDENLRIYAKKHAAVDLFPVQTGSAIAVNKKRFNSNSQSSKTIPLINRNLRIIEDELSIVNQENTAGNMRETAAQVGVLAGIVAITSLFACVAIYISFMTRSIKEVSILYKNDNPNCSSVSSNGGVAYIV